MKKTTKSTRILHSSIAALVVVPLLSVWSQRAQAATITWDGGTAGTSQSWQTAASWAGDVLPGVNDIASFAAAGTPTSNQVGSAGNVSIQALQVQSTRTLDLTIGNSSTATNFTMTLSGTTIAAIANTVLSYERTSGTLNVNNVTAGGSGTGRSFNVLLNNATDNVFQVAAGGTVNMNTVIQQGAAGYRLTKEGGGVLVLAAANTFSGPVTVNGGTTGTNTLRVQNATGLGTGTAVTLNTGTVAAGQGTTLDIRNTITVATGKTLTMNSNGTGVDFRSTLLNGANNNSWNSAIVAAGTGLVQINAASGTTLTIGGGVTSTGGAGTGTLFTRGAGTVIYTGLINLGTDRIFNKTDAGTVIVNSTGNSWVRTQSSDGQIQIGANNALPNVDFTIGQNSATNGRLELNGFNQTVAALRTFTTSTGTNHIIRNSNLSTASTLAFTTAPATTDILKGASIRNVGALTVEKNGTGRFELQDVRVENSALNANDGTLAFTGTTGIAVLANVGGLAGATIDKAGTGEVSILGNYNHAGPTTVTLGRLNVRNGTSGSIAVADGATLGAGVNGGALNSGALTFGTAGATTFAPTLGAPAVTALITAASLTTNGTTTVTPESASFAMGTYPLINFTGSIGGAGNFALGAVGTYPHMTASLDNTTDPQVLSLVVSAPDSLIWTGATNSTFDVNTTANFALASSSTTSANFFQSDAVVFGDTSDVPAAATPVANRALTTVGEVRIGNLTFNNSVGNDYSITGILAGPGGVTKTNTGTVTLASANTFNGPVSVTDGVLILGGANVGTGAVTVTGGTLRLGNGNAISSAPSVLISPGGTLDVNGAAPDVKIPHLHVSGAGVGGNGAIVNNGAGITNNNHATIITLDGDTTWGGSARYDVNNTVFNGGTFTLTKTGAGELWYQPAAGSTLGNVIVNQGTFGSQTTNPLATTSIVTVENGAFHSIFSAVGVQHQAVLNDGGTLRSNNSTPTFNGTVTLNGSDTNRFLGATTGTQLNIQGLITGSGGFTKNDVGTVQLQNAGNNYLGDTAIAAGTLRFNTTGVLPTTTNLIFSGGTLDPANRTHSVASISGASGSINQGTAGTGVVISTQTTPTTFSGTVNRVTVQMDGIGGSLTLDGIADNSTGLVIANAGTVVLAKTGDYAVHAIGSGNLGLTINNSATVQIGGSLTAVTGGSASNNPPADITPTTPPANYVDQLFNFTDVQLSTGGTLDLNGRIEAIDGLAGGGTVTNTSGTTARLYVGYNNTTSTSAGFLGNTSTFSGVIQNGTGTTEFTKLGTGTLVLSGANSHTGATTVTAGTLTVAATGSLGNTPVAINTGGTFAPSGNVGATGGITLNTGGTLNVGGNSGGVTANTISSGSLSLAGGTVNIDFTGTVADRINTSVNDGLSMTGTNTVNVLLGPSGWVTGSYPVYTYIGALQGAGTAALSLSTPIGHNVVTFNDDTAGTVNMNITAGTVVWNGDGNLVVGDQNKWDNNSTLNWFSTDELFLNGDNVLFDTTAATYTPAIAANVTPASIKFINDVANPYTLSGAAGIAGTGQLTKDGLGTVTLLNPNTYTGKTNVLNGTLVANYNAGAAVTVLAAASVVDIAGPGTFRAISNDADLTFGNNVIGTGTLNFDLHATADAAFRNAGITGSLSGFTGTLSLTPTTGTNGFRITTDNVNDLGGAMVNVGTNGQIFVNTANLTFPNNFTIVGNGSNEAAGRLGAIRAAAPTTFSGTITVNGAAKIGAHAGTANITGTLAGGTLTFGGNNNNSAETLNLTGNASGLTGLTVNDALATGNANTILFNVGSGTASGTLGAVPVTLQGDGFKTAVIRFDRTDGYALGAGVTSLSPTTANNVRTQLQVDTLGTGFSTNGQTIDLGGSTATGGSFRVGQTRVGAIASVNSMLTAGSVNVATGATNATLNILPSAIITSQLFYVGEQNSFAGNVVQTGGSVTVNGGAGTTGNFRLGHWPNEVSNYTLSGAGALLDVNGTTAANPSGGGEQNGGIYVGIDGVGIFNQSGGTVSTNFVVLDNRGDIAQGANESTNIDKYNLSAGTLGIRGAFGIIRRNPSAEFNFSGGTIQNIGSGVNATIDAPLNITGTTATIDTNGATNEFTVIQGMTGSGDLTKIGVGKLRVSVASPAWSGDLYAEGGTTVIKAALGDGTNNVTVDSPTHTNVDDPVSLFFTTSQTLSSLTIGDNGTVTLDALANAPEAFAGAGDDFGGAGGDLAAAPLQGVPEPGSAMLLFGGMLTILGLRRRR